MTTQEAVARGLLYGDACNESRRERNCNSERRKDAKAMNEQLRKPERSASRIAPHLALYVRQEHGSEDVPAEDYRAAISDMMTDLLHEADRRGLDGEAVARTALANYEAELHEQAQARQEQARCEQIIERIAESWPAVAGDLREGVPVGTVTDRVVDTMDESEEAGLLPLLHELARL